MTNTSKNKKLYTKIWKVKKIKSHKFWSTWTEFRKIIPRQKSNLLDIGCGIRPRIPVKNSYFVDLSESALNILEKYGGHCYCGDAKNLPYKSGFFDFINASEVLEHIKQDELVIREIKRVLKPNGYFSFSVPMNMKYWSKFDDIVNHMRRYSPEELYNKINNNGLKIQSYCMNEPTKSKVYKNIASVVLKKFPKLAVFIEEYITLPISERIQKINDRKWLCDKFIENLTNASGVIIICQKI